MYDSPQTRDSLGETAAPYGHAASDHLPEIVYRELRKLARCAMRRERPGHTLQPTALVNEAWLRLMAKPVDWDSRAVFLQAASRTMRQILVDHARNRKAAKRGGCFRKVELGDPVALAEQHPATLLALDAALAKLGLMDPRSRQVVELRYFAGLTVEETAQVLNVTEKTVSRDWTFARTWLESELRRE